MKRNEGTLDRVLRGILAVAAIGGAVAVGLGSVVGIVLLVVGIVLVVTAIAGFCPLYGLLGLRTCPVENRTANGSAPRDHVGTAS